MMLFFLDTAQSSIIERKDNSYSIITTLVTSTHESLTGFLNIYLFSHDMSINSTTLRLHTSPKDKVVNNDLNPVQGTVNYYLTRTSQNS